MLLCPNVSLSQLSHFPVVDTFKVPNSDVTIEIRSVMCLPNAWYLVVIPVPYRHHQGNVSTYGQLLVSPETHNTRVLPGPDASILDVLLPQLEQVLLQHRPDMYQVIYPDAYLVDINYRKLVSATVNGMNSQEMRALTMHSREMLEDIRRLVGEKSLMGVISKIQDVMQIHNC